jgi:diguanylate cyclase (GGDEF)-like protein
MSEVTTCPTCGGSGLLPEAGPPRPGEELLSDRDQTANDQDQTWSDQDQTGSDQDTESAAEDQQAADEDFEAGGDSAQHERTRRARTRTAATRDEVSSLRDETASGRVTTADERDRAALERDREAAARDALAASYDQHAVVGLADVRLEAERDRAHAASDRARAAADRAVAARERAEAQGAAENARREIARAATDQLTGAWTRSFGLRQIARELDRAHRTGGTLTLAFVDVDRLKDVNDAAGHAGGDRLLQLVAWTMRGNLRAYDVVVRYGGDEFLCAMPNISRDAAAERMTVIAATLSAAETGHAISFGLAEYQPDDSLTELIERADAGLLDAKRRRDT